MCNRICNAPFWLSLFKMCFGLICFAMFTTTFLNETLYAKFCYGLSVANCTVRRQITEVACVAFTFVIEPACIAAIVFSGKRPRPVLTMLLNFVGLTTYVTGGCMILNLVFSHPHLDFPPSATITGIFFILTATSYFYHLGHMLYRRCKDDDK